MICGIDPGLDGAIAIVGPDIVTILDMPTIKERVNGKLRRKIDLPVLARFFDLHGGAIKLAVIEDVGPMPTDGPVQAFKFGFNSGAPQAAVACQFIKPLLVTPNVWKAAMGLTADKDLSRRMASQLAPHYSHLWARKKDDGRAESFLLAKYGERLG